jgi:Lrp/AsnC family transcriptional regulator, regulator for asnA, asnC and gidA
LKKTPDALDQKLIRLLTQCGRMPIGEIAQRLNITAPTVRGRIKSLEEAGLLKISGLIDPCRHQELTTALIGLSVQGQGKLDEILKELTAIESVAWAAVVTGRYDIIAEVVVSGGMEEIYRLTTGVIPSIGKTIRSETFVIMKSVNKWLRLPEETECPEEKECPEAGE